MLSAFQQKTARLLDTLAQSIPHFCALCHSTCSLGICESCLDRYFTDTYPRCRHCAHRLAESRNDALLCGACLKRPPAFDQVITAADYAPPVDQLVQSLKFSGHLALAPLFARLLLDAIKNAFPEKNALPDMLIPVPLARVRLAARGFNQALEMGRPLSRQLAVPLVPNLVRRIRETAPQTTIALNERRKNIRGAFALNQSALPAVREKHVAIVDDVLTTGETMGELARILKQAGAARVSGFVFTRTSL